MQRSHEIPTRVLFVSHVAALGGGERSLVDLLCLLDRARFSPSALVPAPGELSRRLESIGIEVHYCAGMRRLRRDLGLRDLNEAFRAARRVRRIIEELGPHLVHANSSTAALYAGVPGVGRRASPPIVWSLRDLRVPVVVRHWLARSCSAAIVPSQAIADTIRATIAGVRLHTIPSAVVLDRSACVAAEANDARPEALRILTVGQLVPWKNHRLVVEIARRVRESGVRARFTIVGDDRFGDAPGAALALTDAIRAANLEGDVALLGYRSDVAQLMRESDLLLHPAFPEPFGRVVVEALLCGRPVLAFDGAHGPAEIVRRAGGGLLVGPHDAAAMAGELVRLARDRAELDRLGHEGAAGVQRHFEPAALVRRVEGVYEALAAGGGTGCT